MNKGGVTGMKYGRRLPDSEAAMPAGGSTPTRVAPTFRAAGGPTATLLESSNDAEISSGLKEGDNAGERALALKVAGLARQAAAN